MPKIGIVTAMETEVWPLVRNWKRVRVDHGGRSFRFFEDGGASVLCGGIGYEAGQRAAEVMITHAQPAVLIAAGLAGGLRPEWTLGKTMVAATVIDEATGDRFSTVSGEGTVVSSREIARLADKRRLAQKFAADLVDMEGAAVASVAKRHGIPLLAVKSVSDDFDFELPPLQQFVDAEGRFGAGRFAAYAALRPQWWPVIARLKRHSEIAAAALAKVLTEIIHQQSQQAPVRRALQKA